MRFRGVFRVATLTGFEPDIQAVCDCEKTHIERSKQEYKRITRPFHRLSFSRRYSQTVCPKVSENFRALQWRLDCARRFGFKSLFGASPYRKQNSFLAACGEGAGFAGMAKCGKLLAHRTRSVVFAMDP